MSEQLSFDWAGLSLADLQAMLRAGLVCAAGATADGRVTSYCLTAAGRILLANQTTEHLPDFLSTNP